MNEQNYVSHTRWVKGYHFVLGTFLIIGTICSLVNIYRQWTEHNDTKSAILIALLFICSLQLFWYSRVFAVKAQDRAIRAEENFRYFILTGKPIQSGITMSQIIALRFAPDDEFPTLADQAAKENLSPDEIKKAIKNWRADHHRA